MTSGFVILQGFREQHAWEVPAAQAVEVATLATAYREKPDLIEAGGAEVPF